MIDYIYKILKGFWTLLVGMKVTVPHLGKKAITIQYPKEKMEMFDRFRGKLGLKKDPEIGKDICTACMLCVMACPSFCINITSYTDENKKKRPQTFEIDMGLCCYCGLCVESCPQDCLLWTDEYEYSTYDRNNLIMDKESLERTWDKF